MAELANTERPPDDNPYVGPRTFIREEAHKFFGRDRQARNLIALIVAEQLVLFYAQSGAGKSSLLNTKVMPGLEKEGFEVLPVGAVRGHSGFAVEADNIFIYNLISSLQQKDEAIPGHETMTLAQFLDCLVREEGAFYYNCDYTYTKDEVLKPRVLLIDQFEEILTTNTPFWEQREEFFKQLAEAMALDDQLWVVLTMREDFVGGLDPYLYLLPDAQQNHFYMRRLTRDTALEAITKPVEKIRPFEDDAAQILVDNLRKIEVKERDREAHLGEFVEPVQLQAVCYQMWERLKERPGRTITKEDVAEFADVDTALINFYEDTIAAAVADTGVSEIDLRAWFEKDLVTEAGTRNMVFRGDERTGSLPTAVADYLKGKFIIREVARPGGVWFELIHDRFVEPIVQANQKWRLDQPLIQLCQEWVVSGRSATYLLSGQQLENYEQTNWQALGPLVAEFVAASEEARDLREQQRAAAEAEAAQKELRQQQALAEAERVRAEEAERATARQIRLTGIAVFIGLIAIIASIVAIYYFIDAQNQAEEAQANAIAAQDNAVRAEAEADVAGTRSMESVDAQLKAESARITAVRALSTAQVAQVTSDAARNSAIIAQATSEYAATQAIARGFEQQTRVAEVETARAQIQDSLNQQAALLETLLEQSLTTTPTPEFVAVVEVAAADEPIIEALGTPTSGPTPTLTPTATPTILVTANAQEEFARQLAEVRVKQTAVANYGRDEATTETLFLGASVSGNPIEAVRFGTGSDKILLVGGIHAGKSPSTVAVANEIIAYYDQHPEEIPEDVTLIVVPNLNPDAPAGIGQDAGRFNADGVDLNRNWNCLWEENPLIGTEVVEGAGGTEPLSEPESRALANFIREEAPAAVIAWFASGTPVVDAGGCPSPTLSEPLMALYAAGAGYREGDVDTGTVFPGALTNWVDSLGIPAISVLLPSDENSDFENNLLGLEEVIAFYSQQ